MRSSHPVSVTNGTGIDGDRRVSQDCDGHFRYSEEVITNCLLLALNGNRHRLRVACTPDDAATPNDAKSAVGA